MHLRRIELPVAGAHRGIAPAQDVEIEQVPVDRLEHAHAPGSQARLSWARLLKRVFDIDVEYCPRCGGTLKIVAAIVDPQ